MKKNLDLRGFREKLENPKSKLNDYEEKQKQKFGDFKNFWCQKLENRGGLSLSSPKFSLKTARGKTTQIYIHTQIDIHTQNSVQYYNWPIWLLMGPFKFRLFLTILIVFKKAKRFWREKKRNPYLSPAKCLDAA